MAASRVAWMVHSLGPAAQTASTVAAAASGTGSVCHKRAIASDQGCGAFTPLSTVHYATDDSRAFLYPKKLLGGS